MANLTRLQGVNRVLSRSGIRPVAALDTGGSSEAADAENFLKEAEHDLAISGFYDNKTMAVTHTASGTGIIILGGTVIAIKAAGSTQYRNFSMRLNGANMEVYDLDKNTFVLGANEQIQLDLTFEIPFESCAPGMQDAILKAASQNYQNFFRGSPLVDQQLGLERLRADATVDRALGGPRDRSNPPVMSPQQQRQGQGG